MVVPTRYTFQCLSQIFPSSTSTCISTFSDCYDATTSQLTVNIHPKPLQLKSTLPLEIPTIPCHPFAYHFYRKRPIKHQCQTNYSRSRKIMAVTGQHYCAPCKRKFNRRSSWRRHMDTVHVPNDTYICTINDCNMRFKRKDVLERHKANQHGISKIECPDCGHHIRKDALQEHQRRLHTSIHRGSLHPPPAPLFGNRISQPAGQFYAAGPDNGTNFVIDSPATTASSPGSMINVCEQAQALDSPSNGCTISSSSDSDSLLDGPYQYTGSMESFPFLEANHNVKLMPNESQAALLQQQQHPVHPRYLSEMESAIAQPCCETSNKWNYESHSAGFDGMTEVLQAQHKGFPSEVYANSPSAVLSQSVNCIAPLEVEDEQISGASMELGSFGTEDLRPESEAGSFGNSFTSWATALHPSVGDIHPQPPNYGDGLS